MKIDMPSSITRLLLCVAIGLSFIGAGSVARADDMAYLATGGGSFGTIDLTTGVYTQLGLTPVPLAGLAVMGTTLYGAGAGANNQSGQLYSVNPSNGNLTPIGSPTGTEYTAFGSYNGTLYAIDHSSANAILYSINASTGAATLIGHTNTGTSLAGYWALSNNSTALYFQVNSGLYTLNTTTGQSSPVGALGDHLQAGVIVEVGGKLYAGQDNTSDASLEILALDKSTGAATVVSKVSGSGISYIYGLAPLISSFASSDTFFPQVAVGSGMSTLFALSNTGGSTVITGNLVLMDQQGSPFTVSSTGFGVGSSFPVSIPPGGTTFLTVNSLSPNDAVKSGWAAVETSGGSLSGVATYQFISGGVLQYATGVLSTQPMQFATIPVNENHSAGLYTAFAIANPTNEILTVKLALVDPNGNVVNDVVIPSLNPGQQSATYLYQALTLGATFQGSMVLRAQGGGTFVAVALVQNQQLFTAIPVIPSKAPNIPN